MELSNEKNSLFTVERFVLKEFEKEYSLGKELPISKKNIEGLSNIMFLTYQDMFKKATDFPNSIYIINKKVGIESKPIMYFKQQSYKKRGFSIHKINNHNNIFDSDLIAEFDNYNIFEENKDNPVVKLMELPYLTDKFNKFQVKSAKEEKEKLKKQNFRQEFEMEIGEKLASYEKSISSVFGKIIYPKSFDIEEFSKYFNSVLMTTTSISKEIPPDVIKKIGINSITFKEQKTMKTMKAYYDVSSNSIVINVFHGSIPNVKELVRTVLHEFGHALDDMYLSKNTNYRNELIKNIRRLDYVKNLRLNKKEYTKRGGKKNASYVNYYTYRLQADELIADIFSYYMLAKYKKMNPLDNCIETVKYFALEMNKVFAK